MLPSTLCALARNFQSSNTASGSTLFVFLRFPAIVLNTCKNVLILHWEYRATLSTNFCSVGSGNMAAFTGHHVNPTWNTWIFWGAVKEKLFEKRPQTVDELKEFVLQASVDIDANWYLCATVCHGVRDRLQECIDVDEGHSEHVRDKTAYLLWPTLYVQK